MKNKGFTLVELLAVIVILVMMGMIVIPNVTDKMKKADDTYNEIIKNSMMIAGRDYFSSTKNSADDNRTLHAISLKELFSLGYIDKKTQDSDKKSCMEESYIIKIDDYPNSSYYACLKCGSNNYITSKESEYCKIKIDTEINPQDVPTCKLSKSNNKIVVEATDDNAIIKIYGVSNSGKEINFLSNENVSNNKKTYKIDITSNERLDIYTVDNNYNKKYCGTIND